MTTLSQVGEQLRVERQKQKLMKTQLAEASGVHRNTLRNLEAGSGNVELNTLIAVCDVLGLDIVLAPKEVSDMLAPAGGPQKTALQKMLAEKLGGSSKESK